MKLTLLHETVWAGTGKDAMKDVAHVSLTFFIDEVIDGTHYKGEFDANVQPARRLTEDLPPFIWVLSHSPGQVGFSETAKDVVKIAVREYVNNRITFHYMAHLVEQELRRDYELSIASARRALQEGLEAVAQFREQLM